MTDSTPAFRYSAKLAQHIEPKWHRAWDAARVNRAPNPGEAGFDPARPKYYVLDMFPYPSGAGLHVGHPEGYTATDILARYKRMRGFAVLHPMGWDAFGLPAEQYAIQTGVHPALTTRKAIDTFRAQLQRFGFSYDWSRELGTIDETYYRWTQWIFLQLYASWFDLEAPVRDPARGTGRARPIVDLEREFANGTRPVRYSPRADDIPEADRARDLGPWSALDPTTRTKVLNSYRLAYLGETTVNWCPKLGTVLANDEVIDGKSERGGHPVLRKPLRQWMFRITAYADRLLDQLESLAWPASTKTMQREWIGRSEGAEVEFWVGRLSEPTSTPPSKTSTFSTQSHPLDRETAPALRASSFRAADPYPSHGPAPSSLQAVFRSSLPHLELPGATYFVTWRTAGWRLSDEGKSHVLRALMHFDGERCEVYAACVMDTHAHWIVRPFDGHSLRELVASVKRYSATQVNKLEGVKGSLWQEDAFDHIIRDERWLGEFVWYVARNAVEARACASVERYAWTYVSDSLRTLSDERVALRPRTNDVVADYLLSLDGARLPPLGDEAGFQTQGTEANGKGLEGVGSESRPTNTTLTVFTTRPDTLFGATFMVVAPEHPLCDAVLAGAYNVDPATRDSLRAYVLASRNRSDVERQESKDKTGVFTGVYATNPATAKPVPIWTADYVLMGYGSGAIMAVPAHDDRDFAFAKKYDLPIVQVVQPPQGVKVKEGDCFSAEGTAINSASPGISLEGLSTRDAKAAIIAWLESKGLGRKRVQYRLRDWTFSRQRYWGEPFPIVFDASGNHYPVRDSALPVKLPELADYAPVESDDPQPLLAKATTWVSTTAGEAGVDPALLHPSTPVTRETNTMPGSAGSSWYAIRYCDPACTDRLVGRDAEAYWMGPAGGDASRAGVDLYMGGSEHAVGHLLYARFWQSVLFDLGHVTTPEPFRTLFHQGMITSFAYQRSDKSLVPVDQVREESEGVYVEAATGARVTQIVAKMSKSLRNVINPDDVIAEYGADTFRLYEMAMGPLEASKPWNPRDIAGCYRFLQRAWRLLIDEETGAPRLAQSPAPALERQLHRAVDKVGKDIERLAFNTAIAALIEFVNAATAADSAASAGSTGPGVLTQEQADRFLRALCPLAPHLAEEAWERLGLASRKGMIKGMIVTQPWPDVDPAMLVDDEVEVPVSVAGKVRARILIPAGAAKDAKALEAAALAHPEVQALLEGKQLKRLIAVPGKMVNLVV